MAAVYRLYVVNNLDTLEETLVWAYSQSIAVRTVVDHNYTVAPVTQRELCRMVASGNHPINDPPDEGVEPNS